MESSSWSRTVTIAAVLMLAGIAAVVSYSHMYELALRHGEPEWRAALFPLSVDGMIVASSMTLLSDARRGRKSGVLPWALLIIGSAASLAANVAGRRFSAWSRIFHVCAESTARTPRRPGPTHLRLRGEHHIPPVSG